MNALGKHVIVELYDCNTEIINNQALMEQVMVDAVQISGATLVKTVFHKFSPHGITGIAGGGTKLMASAGSSLFIFQRNGNIPR